MNSTRVVMVSESFAFNVLVAMKQLLDHYEVVSLADFRELAGVTSSFTDQSVGWTELENISIKEENGGFVLDLPEPKPLGQ